jgi:hypothetical protein
VKGGRVEPPVRLPAATILAKLDDIAGHGPSPGFTSLRPRLRVN